MQVRPLLADHVSLIASIDRSEHVDIQYGVIEGRLVEQPVAMTEVPAWDPTGSGPHSVAVQVAYCAELIANGAVLLGAFDDDDDEEEEDDEEERPKGLAVVDPSFEPRLAWLAFLYVTRPHRRRGAGRALWGAAVELARAEGAASLYVSAVPTGSAIGFYLRQSCHLAAPVHPALFAKEPEDIHLVRPLP